MVGLTGVLDFPLIFPQLAIPARGWCNISLPLRPQLRSTTQITISSLRAVIIRSTGLSKLALENTRLRDPIPDSQRFWSVEVSGSPLHRPINEPFFLPGLALLPSRRARFIFDLNSLGLLVGRVGVDTCYGGVYFCFWWVWGYTGDCRAR